MADQCLICYEHTPSLHSHHTVPQSYGGKDSIQVPVCANCHNSIHRELNRLLARHRKHLQLGAIKWQNPKHAEEITIASKVIEIGIMGVLQYEIDSTKVYKVPVALPVNIHNGLKSLKEQGNFPSLEKTIIECIKLGLHTQNIKF